MSAPTVLIYKITPLAGIVKGVFLQKKTACLKMTVIVNLEEAVLSVICNKGYRGYSLGSRV